jgi:hypothetical protein
MRIWYKALAPAYRRSQRGWIIIDCAICSWSLLALVLLFASYVLL